MLCAAIDLEALNKYTDKRLEEGPNRTTIQKEHRVLRHALRLAKDLGYYLGDPSALKVEGFIESRGNRGLYQPGETWLERVEWIEALVAHTSANPDKHRVDRRDDILVYTNLGLRRREPLLIKPEHVDLKARTVTIRMPRKEATASSKKSARKTGLKTDKSKRVLPLNALMVELFKRHLRSVPAGSRSSATGARATAASKRTGVVRAAWLLERAEKGGGAEGAPSSTQCFHVA